MATKAATNKKSTSSSSRAKASVAKTTVTKTVVTRAAAAAPVAAADSASFSVAVNSLSFWRALAFELIGTFLLAGAALIYQETPLYLLFAVVGIVLITGTVSGAHINPAITVASWVTRRIGWVRAIGYIVAQVFGAWLAYALLQAFAGAAPTPDSSSQSLGAAAPSVWQALTLSSKDGWLLFASELVGTAIIGFAVVHSLKHYAGKINHAFTYGAGVFVALTFSYTVASYYSASAVLNPALAFATRAVDLGSSSFSWTTVWVYLLGPLLGAIIGFGLYDLFHGKLGKKQF